MASQTPAAPQQRFSVPAPFYWAVRTVHATAPALVALGNLETSLLGRKLENVKIDRPVYICGLPRAGTTISLQMISEHPDVAAHKYADFLMPYLPYAWNWFFPRVPVNAMRDPQPRIHRDRIDITRDSVEMCEEMVWERFFPNLYGEDKTNSIDGTISNPAFAKFYRENIAKFMLVHNKTRYASKAIMCVLRMQYIRTLFPDAKFLFYVRNPVDQIASLIKQDRIFDEIDDNDHRQIEIIEMTGHHEFGRRQILPNVGNTEEVRQVRERMDRGDKVGARARVWAYVNRYVLQQLSSDPGLAAATVLVRYEDLCGNAPETIDRIVKHTQLDAEKFAPVREKYIAKLSLPDYYKPMFDNEQLADIVNVTSPIASQFGYDVAARAGTAAAAASAT